MSLQGILHTMSHWILEEGNSPQGGNFSSKNKGQIQFRFNRKKDVVRKGDDNLPVWEHQQERRHGEIYMKRRTPYMSRPQLWRLGTVL